MIQTVSVGIVADNTSIAKTGNVISVKDDGVGKAKLNADVVGIATATGKVNTINSTNFTSLDASNLTSAGDLSKIETKTLSGASKTFASSTIDVSAYKQILVIWSIYSSSSEQDLLFRINADANGNYNWVGVQLSDATAVSGSGDTSVKVGRASAGTSQGHLFINLDSKKELSGVGGHGGTQGFAIQGEYTQTGAVTEISFITPTTDMTTASKFTVYGLK